MERKKQIVLVICGILAFCLIFVDIYAFGIAVVLVGVLAMTFFIAEDTRDLPDVAASLREDAGAVILSNRGNTSAFDVKAVFVPLDREITIPELKADESMEYPLGKMVEGVKVLVSFSNRERETFSRSYILSPLQPGDEDLLKPVFPLFRWR